MKKPLVIATALALSACVTAAPTVTDFNGASVKLNTDVLTAYPNSATNSDAARICGISAKRAEYASTRPIPSTGYEHLYLCL